MTDDRGPAQPSERIPVNIPPEFRRMAGSVVAVSLAGAMLVFASTAPSPMAAAQNGLPITVTSSPAEFSTIAIPIRASLRPLLPLLERRVPAAIDRSTSWEIEPRGRFAMRYQVVREPIALKMIGNGLHATSTIRYAVEGCRRTANPFSGEVVLWPCLSCGFAQPMRRAEIALQTTLEWDAEWRLRSSTRAAPVHFPDRCRVTLAQLDITDWKIAPEVNRQLQEAVRTIDANTPALTRLRPEAGSAWSSLQEPVAIGPRSWLLIEPSDVSFTPIQGTGLEVTSTLRLRARIRVVVADTAPLVVKKPLPSLGRVPQAAGGLRVPVDIELPYDDASRLLTESFGHRRYGDMAVGAIGLARGGDGKVRVRLEVDYRASMLQKYRGSVDLEGTPVYDPSLRLVALTGLEYTLDPTRRNLFVSVADRLAHRSLRDQLERNAHWPIGAAMDQWKSQIARALTRSLGQGATMSGSISSLEPAIASIGDRAIVLRVVAAGNAEIRLAGQ